MSADKRESGIAMLGDGVAGAVPILEGVALFATVVEWRRRELIVVRILVAIRA